MFQVEKTNCYPTNFKSFSRALDSIHRGATEGESAYLSQKVGDQWILVAHYFEGKWQGVWN